MTPASLRTTLALAVTVGTLATCGPESPGSSTSGGEGKVDAGSDALTTLTVLDPNFEAIFNPSWSMPARFLVFSPLVDVAEDGEIEPRLARRWEHSEDYREWTFHLRTDVRWHDGEPFDARDVAFTLRRMSHPEVLYRQPLDTVVVLDDSTVTIRREEPWSIRENGGWWVHYPEHLLAGVEPSEFFEAEFWTRPVGTGPFRYVRHTPKTVFVLEANPDYYRDGPRVDRVRIKFGGGEPLVELRAGNVDVATYVSRALIPHIREDPALRTYHHAFSADFGSPESLLWNHDHPFLGDAAVRRALTMAIDRRELRRLLYVPDDLPVVDVPFSPRQVGEGALPPPLPYDPRRARVLLDSAGWRDTDGDGIRTKGAHQARFTVLVGGNGTAAGGPTPVYVQAALREVGVRMEIRRLESGLKDRIEAGEFEAAIREFAWGAQGLAGWSEDSASGYSHGYYDPELDRIFHVMDTVFAPAIRDSLYRESWRIFRRDLPVTLLAPELHTFAAHRRVRGLESPFRAHPYVAAADLRIEEVETQ